MTDDLVIVLTNPQLLEALGDYIGKHRLAPVGTYEFDVLVGDKLIQVKLTPPKGDPCPTP